MTKIPFNIMYRPQIESGDFTVVTREDRLVEIKIWDLKGDFPVVGVYYDEENNREIAVQVTDEGKCSINLDDYCDDFFIVTETSKLMKLKQELSQMLDFYGSDPDNTKESAIEKWSQKLLSVAEEEVARNYRDKYNEGRSVGIELGKTEAMKNIPKWHKAEIDAFTYVRIAYIAEGMLYSKGYKIDISELEKLPKEN